MSVALEPFHPPTNRRGKLRCLSCNNYFEASARRVRMTQREQASRYCDDCRKLKRQKPINVTEEHRRYWTNRLDVFMFYDRERGEMVTLTQEWIDEIAALIWHR